MCFCAGVCISCGHVSVSLCVCMQMRQEVNKSKLGNEGIPLPESPSHTWPSCQVGKDALANILERTLALSLSVISICGCADAFKIK